ncbi:hypothetical protein ACFQE1_02975 [Halobium palmae]|uniref:Universal stress protein n=1 Tax=Halobium palmae TaxID=1776492 RepID=A0ABD5RWP9_9EURY
MARHRPSARIAPDSAISFHVVNVTPTGRKGTAEETEETLSTFDDRSAIEVHRVESDDIAASLADVAEEVGGPLLVGASRNRVFKRYVLGGVADDVVALSTERGFPALVYASRTGLSGLAESAAFATYRYLLKSRS